MQGHGRAQLFIENDPIQLANAEPARRHHQLVRKMADHFPVVKEHALAQHELEGDEVESVLFDGHIAAQLHAVGDCQVEVGREGR